jgi:hypothetical protein
LKLIPSKFGSNFLFQFIGDYSIKSAHEHAHWITVATIGVQ